MLILSAYPERQYAVNVLKAGASGYLSKESAPDELLKASPGAGRQALREREPGELLVSDWTPTTTPTACRPLGTEFQIFCKLAAGQSVSEIAMSCR